MRKSLQRLAALLCAAVMALTLCPAQAWAEEPEAVAETPVCSYMFINPLLPYSGGDIALFNAPADYATLSASGRVPLFSSVQEAAAYARQELKNRRYLAVFMDFPKDWTGMDDSQQRAYCDQLADQVLTETIRHTGDPTGGDYLLYHFYGFGYTTFPQEGFCRVILQVGDYLDNAAQEQETAGAASRILQELRLEDMSEYEKICAIYGWLCSNVDYDDSEPADATALLLQHSAYAALVQNKAVCQGYATAFYRLALMAGLDARVITGTGFGGYDAEGGELWGPHGWNIVKLDGRWYYVDATWDAGYSEEEEWDYFLRASLLNHKLDDHGEAVAAQYTISPTDYGKGSGDLNGDDTLDITDVQLLYTFLLTGETPTGASMQEADVNGDQGVDVYDLQLLYEMVNGLV